MENISITTYRGFSKVKGRCSLNELIEKVRSSRYAVLIEKIGRLISEGKTKEAENVKRQLDYFTVTANYHECRLAHSIAAYNDIITIDLRPDFHNFDRLTREFGLGISPRNYDAAALLYISENGYAGIVAADKVHPFSYEYEFRELAEKLEDSMKARMNAPLSAHDFGYAALQKEAREMAADLLQSEFHITDGEFRLGARISRTERMETSHPMSRPHLEEVKTGKSPETYRRQETPGQKPSDRQRQARHVAPIAPQKKEKKQLIL